MRKKIQLAKLYRDGFFIGYGVAVDGELVEGQLSTVITSEPRNAPTIMATFNITKEQDDNPIIIEV